MFNLSEASEGSTQLSYQTPGIYDNVSISEVVLEETSTNKVPYMKLVTKGANGEIGQSPKMFLSTDVKPGKKTSGWGVTARNLVDLLKATYNISDDEAKSKMPSVNSAQELIEKVSALLVGKSFRAKFKGVTSSKGLVYAELGQAESMRVENTAMRYDPARDIKPFEGTTTVSTTDAIGGNDALPF